MSKSREDDELPPQEIAERVERTVRRLIATPPKPHKPLGKRKGKRIKRKRDD